jgi:ribose/xylose/arabinose/galactoside ABC-type transport system permease subunit
MITEKITDNSDAKSQAVATPFSIQRFVRSYGLILVLVGITLMFTLIQPAFVSFENIVGILYQVSLIGTMAVCATFVIMTGGIDLSVGPVLAMAGLYTVFSLNNSEQNLIPALAIGLFTGLVCGLLNGLAVSLFKLPPIIVTLASMSIFRGVALLTGGSSVHQVSGPPAFLFIGGGKIAGLPFPIFIFAAVALFMLFLQTRTRFGLNVFAVGENEEAARLCGLPVTRTRLLVYIISGVGAALGGIMLASQVNTAWATYGNGIELDVIAAVVLGGTSLAGGSGSVYRTVIGALLIGEMNNGMSMLNIRIEHQLIAKGVIIILAIALNDRLVKWAEK